MILEENICDLAIFSIWQRCGSTLLLRMANTRDKSLVWGEISRWPQHFANLLRGSVRFSKASEGVREVMLTNRPDLNSTHMNYLPNFSPDEPVCRKAIIEAMRSYFKVFRYPGFDLVGFKEVMLDGRAIKLCREAFPDTPFILLVRNPLKIWRSLPYKWIENSGYTANEFIEKWNSAYLEYAETARHDPNCYLIYYEDVIEKDETTLATLADLMHLSIEDLMGVLEIRTKSTSKLKDAADEQVIVSKIQCETYTKERAR